MTTNDKKALIVVTSHNWLGTTKRRTGFHFEELAVPYWKFRDAGYSVDIASTTGGAAFADPSSIESTVLSASVQRFMSDRESQLKLDNTLTVESVEHVPYRMVFLAGGHGAMWDFPESTALAQMIGDAYDNGAIVGSVCHGAAGFVQVMRLDGKSLVDGLRVTSFTDAEEEAIRMEHVVPFMLESRLRELGGHFESAENFHSNVVSDRNLVTGQNPASSGPVAESMLAAARVPVVLTRANYATEAYVSAMRASA